MCTASRLSPHLPLEVKPKDTQGRLREDGVDTGEAPASRYDFAGEQHLDTTAQTRRAGNVSTVRGWVETTTQLSPPRI